MYTSYCAVLVWCVALCTTGGANNDSSQLAHSGNSTEGELCFHFLESYPAARIIFVVKKMSYISLFSSLYKYTSSIVISILSCSPLVPHSCLYTGSGGTCNDHCAPDYEVWYSQRSQSAKIGRELVNSQYTYIGNSLFSSCIISYNL